MSQIACSDGVQGGGFPFSLDMRVLERVYLVSLLRLSTSCRILTSVGCLNMQMNLCNKWKMGDSLLPFRLYKTPLHISKFLPNQLLSNITNCKPKGLSNPLGTFLGTIGLFMTL